MAVTLEQMKSKLVPLEQVYTVLEQTEPIHVETISSETKVKFSLDPNWAEGIDALDGNQLVGVSMRVNGVERRMTKNAMLQAAGKHGLGAAYIKKVPAHYIEGLLNWHFSGGMGGTQLSMFTVKDNISAFSKPSLTPFSNLQLLDSTVEGIRNHFGSDLPIFADYKLRNDLQKTNVRLIIPTTERVIRDTGMSDVPNGEDDVWLAGIHLSNSAVARGQTSLEAYLFRWWCTNGATTEMNDVGRWDRRANGQQDDVYSWARDTVDEVLGGMEHKFEEVQALAALNVAGNTAEILREVFSTYGVPVSQRNDIRERLLEAENLTMYTIMQAITQTANDDDLDDKRRDTLMRIGGALPTTQFDTLKAKIWREGHLAQPDEPNPYEIQLVS
jgi:hypothetical protein